MRSACVVLVLALTLATAACGRTSKSAASVSPATTQLTVAGEYPTQVAILTDACGGSQVQSLPTTVVHTAGGTTLQLVHAGSTYSGTIGTDGRFTTTPWTGTFGPASYVITLAGRFTTSGFTATVTLDKTDPAHPTGCRYTVSWVATKSGSPNVLPG
jgi:ABC-type Fe3+-hydroxamate transport system substrate-binding protein